MVNTEVGDRVVIMNPWTLRLSLVVIFFLGIFTGMIAMSTLVYHGIEVVGSSFKVESANLTIAINQSLLLDTINEGMNRSIEKKAALKINEPPDLVNSFCKFKGYDRGDPESKWNSSSTEIVCSMDKGMANHFYTQEEYNEWLGYRGSR